MEGAFCMWRVHRIVHEASDPSWVKLVHTWPPQEQSRALRKAPFRTLKSLTCTGELGTVIMMTYTHRGIGLSATEDLVRKFARSERQTPRSAPRGIIHGRNMTQVGAFCMWRVHRIVHEASEESRRGG